MLSDSDKFKVAPSGRKRAIGAKTSKSWADSQKIEAVTTYLALGDLKLTGAVLKIPEQTLRSWKSTVWWKEVQDELSVQDDLKLSTRLKTIIESTLAAAEDRIRHGDFIYDSKRGELVRRPISLKDAHRVTMDMVQKRIDIAKANVQSIPTEMIEDRLLKLAERMAAIATGQSIPKVIEVTDVIEGSFSESDDEFDDDRSEEGEEVTNDPT